MSKTFKEYEKESSLICPRCNLRIKILNPIPMSIFDDIHEDMYISHEDEYLERKALQQKIDKAIKYIKEFCIDDEFYINLTNKEKCIFDVLSILEGKEVLDE